MNMPKRGEKGFTLIELLIVVAILGVLAAIVIPNVGRFIGSGEEEAAETEFSTIQSAVHSMMIDNGLQTLSPYNGAANATSNMHEFPANGTAVLYQHTHLIDGSTVNYVATQNTTYEYYVDSMGTVTQGDKAE